MKCMRFQDLGFQQDKAQHGRDPSFLLSFKLQNLELNQEDAAVTHRSCFMLLSTKGCSDRRLLDGE